MESAVPAATSDRPPPSRQLSLVQASRGFAALAVTAVHFTMVDTPYKFDGWLEFGKLGVDYFFVLSGFIILYAHIGDIGRPDRLRRFALNRFLRIYPMYWFVLALVVWHLALEARLDLGLFDWLATLSLLRFSPTFTPLQVAWSLFHEILFYGLFAVLIVSRRLGLILFAVWGALILGLLRDPWQAFSAINTVAAAYNLNFFFGMGVCLLVRRSPPGGRLWPVLTVIASLSGVAGLVLYDRWHDVDLALIRPAYGLLFAGALWALVRLDQLDIRVPRILKLLGDASFAIYLTHVVTLRIFCRAVILPNKIGDGLGLVLALAFAAAVGIALRLLLEAPMLTALRAQFSEKARAKPAATTLPAVVRPGS